jgi:hypothetical protein
MMLAAMNFVGGPESFNIFFTGRQNSPNGFGQN